MQKLASLRAAIVAALPELAVDPDRLLCTATKGKIASRGTTSLGYEYRYTASLWLLDFSAESAVLMSAILLWARDNQRDLLEGDRALQAIAFEAEVLDDKTIDLNVQLELTDAVALAPRAGGGHALTFLPEPPRAGFELLSDAPLGEIWFGGTRLFPPA